MYLKDNVLMLGFQLILFDLIGKGDSRVAKYSFYEEGFPTNPI